MVSRAANLVIVFAAGCATYATEKPPAIAAPYSEEIAWVGWCNGTNEARDGGAIEPTPLETRGLLAGAVKSCMPELSEDAPGASHGNVVWLVSTDEQGRVTHFCAKSSSVGEVRRFAMCVRESAKRAKSFEPNLERREWTIWFAFD